MSSGWGTSGGWQDGRAGGEGTAARLSHARCHVHHVRGSGAAVPRRLGRVWLLLCCLPGWGESRRRCQGLPLQPGRWPASLLGNRRARAQLIKLWAEAVQEISGTQDPQKLYPVAPRALPPWGLPDWGGVGGESPSCNYCMKHVSSTLLSIAPLLPAHLPGLPSAPSRQEAVKASGAGEF